MDFCSARVCDWFVVKVILKISVKERYFDTVTPYTHHKEDNSL